MSIVFCLMSIGFMSHVEFKKQPCRPVKFKGQGPFMKFPFLKRKIIWGVATRFPLYRPCGQSVPTPDRSTHSDSVPDQCLLVSDNSSKVTYNGSPICVIVCIVSESGTRVCVRALLLHVRYISKSLMCYVKAMTHQPTQLLSRGWSGPIGVCVIGLQLDFFHQFSLIPDCLVGSRPTYDSTVELGWLMCHGLYFQFSQQVILLRPWPRWVWFCHGPHLTSCVLYFKRHISFAEFKKKYPENIYQT